MRETITPIFSQPNVLGIQRCATFTPNKSVAIRAFNGIRQFFNETLTDSLQIWLHEAGDFYPTYSTLYGSSFIQINVDQNAVPSQFFAIEGWFKDTQSLSTDKNPCIKDNDDETPKVDQCLIDFYEAELKCKLPWNKNHKHDFDLCQTEEQYDSYISLSLKEFFSTSEAEVFKNTGCKPRCIQRHYFEKVVGSGNYPYGKNQDGVIFAIFMKRGEFMFEEEVYMYQWLDFIADIGGYLGLWLGFSALSLCNSLTNKFM